MADDQQGSLPDRTTFRQLRRTDLDELAVKYELEPPPSLDKVGLQTFLKDSLDLEEYWQEQKDKEREEAQERKDKEKRRQDSEREEAQRQREEAQRQERVEKRQQAKETVKTREHKLRMEQARGGCLRQHQPSTLGTQNDPSLVSRRCQWTCSLTHSRMWRRSWSGRGTDGRCWFSVP